MRRDSLEKAAFLIGGIILSATFENYLEGAVSNNIVLLISIIVIFTFIALFILGDIYTNTRQTLDKIVERTGVVFYYLEDTFGQDKFKGVIYREIESIISSAEEEILYLVSTSAKDGRFKQINHPERQKYLKNLEKTIFKRRSAKLTYYRIHQIEDMAVPLYEAVGNETVNHYRQMYDLKQSGKYDNTTVQLMKINLRSSIGILLVDKKTIALFMNDKEHATALFIVDHTGSLISTYHHYIKNDIIPSAQVLTEDDLILENEVSS